MLPAALAPAAHASQTIGEAAAPNVICPGANAHVQKQTADDPSYSVPSGGGVITSWSTNALGGVGQSASLKVLFALSATAFDIVGTDGPRPLTGALDTFPSVASTAQVRIPVSGGETLGIWLAPSATDYHCMSTASDSMDVVLTEAKATDPGVDETVGDISPATMRRLNVAAVLEADADHDGFGDESQDDCPADATRRGPCVVQDSGPGPAQIDSTLPAFLGKPSASPSVFEVNRSGPAETPVTAAAKGTTFRYRLSEPAEVTFAISRATRGRRVGKRCRTQTRGNRKRRRCTRYVAAGAFRDQGVAGQNGKRFSGRIGRKSLKPGRYRATLTAVDAAINRSTPKRIAFRVVKPKRKKR